MTTENQGYIIEVIADLQKRLASETASNKYLRGELETNQRIIEKQREILKQCDFNTENLNAKIAQLQAERRKFDEVLESLNNQIAEQKETIETLQSSLKSYDAEYISLKFDFNELVKKHQDLDTQYMTLKGLDNGK
jgi:chromosome segregation ATPase